eukprot:TRINITY_DN9371_c1_g1_i2.p1 TRINITY_DN9371_c1_g1~~TRINITY_DN9371_c1_g1_i2.p1  ORF type:complete len:132 (-),score=45.92 TRINITY_DN9371_c1_g1_i2:93-488(-)
MLNCHAFARRFFILFYVSQEILLNAELPSSGNDAGDSDLKTQGQVCLSNSDYGSDCADWETELYREAPENALELLQRGAGVKFQQHLHQEEEEALHLKSQENNDHQQQQQQQQQQQHQQQQQQQQRQQQQQ